jgi:hypothetical protein
MLLLPMTETQLQKKLINKGYNIKSENVICVALNN